VLAPQETALAHVVRVAGSRWTVARCGAEAKGESGGAHEEGRSWTGWYRQSTLARGAEALLTVLRAAPLPTQEAPQKTLSQRPPSSLAACKAARGLLSRSVSARGGIASGPSSWPSSRA
jgi:SRSO17 transposase